MLLQQRKGEGAQTVRFSDTKSNLLFVARHLWTCTIDCGRLFIEHTNNEYEYTGSEAFTGKDQIVVIKCDSKGLLGGTGPAKHLVYIS